MDIKKLYDVMNDKYFRFNDPDYPASEVQGEAEAILLTDRDWMADNWMDLLCEYPPETLAKEIVEPLCAVFGEREALRNRRSGEPLWPASTMGIYLDRLSMQVTALILKAVETHVEENIDGWVEDAVNYHHDMQRSHWEDYQDSRAADKRLEERS